MKTINNESYNLDEAPEVNPPKTFKNGNTLKQNLLGLGLLALVIVLLYAWAVQPTVKAEGVEYQPQSLAAIAAYDKALADLQSQAVKICNNELKAKAAAKINDELNSSGKEAPQMDAWNAIRKADCSKVKVTVDWGF